MRPLDVSQVVDYYRQIMLEVVELTGFQVTEQEIEMFYVKLNGKPKAVTVDSIITFGYDSNEHTCVIVFQYHYAA